MVEQFSVVAKKLPESQATLLKNIPGGIGQQVIKSLIQSPAISSEHVVSAGQHFLGTVSDLVFIVAMALYLASDGKRTFMWIRAFFSPVLRRKIDMTAKEGSEIIVAYVLGQVVTSVLCGVFVFIVLSLLHVPAALVLAVMAAAFDILPMLGFFLFTIPAVLFALTVSSSAAITLLILYVIYHFLENYIIVPKIYGKRLRLSELVVLISVLAGACLAGIPGAILILPLVAVYPAFERIWLADYIGRDVVDKHEAVENSPPS